ncbi:hypothetical protein ACWGMA_11640 [Streptomyces asiaticus]
MTTTYDRGPASLVLGAYLRALRLAKGLKLCDAVEVPRSSAAELSRMETGQVAQRLGASPRGPRILVVPFQAGVSTALLDIARRRSEQLAMDPESDPLLEELMA